MPSCLIKLKDALVSVPDRPFPDNFHARTGHALPSEKSNVYKQLISTNQYAEKLNEVKFQKDQIDDI